MGMRVAIPHHDGEVAPCFEYSAHFTVFSISRNRVIAQMDFILQSRKELDRVRLLRDQKVAVLICSGIQDALEGLLSAAGIRVFSWISGPVSEVLNLFLENKLTSGSARASNGASHTATKTGSPTHEEKK
jgi:predicted Fe-Mo cluster-binding NifX family protein